MMMIKKRGFFEILLPLFIVVFIGQGSSLVTTFINSNSRWLLLLVLMVYLFFNGTLLQGLNSKLRIALLLYLAWCVFTVFWSEMPMFSCAKVIAMISISITLTSSGSLWVKKFQWQNSLNWLTLLIIVTLFIGILGRGQASSINSLNGFDAYQGLSSNTNYFGSLQAMISPLLLWQIYKNWHHGKKRILWGGLLVLSMAFLIHSYSRASMLMELCTIIFFILSIDIKRKVVVGSALTLLFVVVLSTLSLSMDNLIYKNRDGDLLQTRRDVWEISYSQAFLGGWTGGGFGVTVGDSGFGFNSLSAVGYGREKSNSQLGIVEETGLIGFAFYCLLLIAFFKKAIRFYFKLRGSEKVMMGLVLGSMSGILLQSFFEAWWDAPASPESIFFWTLFGISAGLMRCLNRNRKLMNGNPCLETTL